MSFHRIRRALFLIAVTSGPLAVLAGEVIQLDVRALLNARSVTTLTDGRLVTWTRGIDGGGKADGYLTREAAAAVGDKDVKALPGDGWFPANARHPAVRLNYSNADGQGGQTYALSGAGEFRFGVEPRNYQRLLLFLTSAEGASQLAITLVYADSSVDQREISLPDYYNAAAPADPNLFSLAEDLAKWNASNRLAERNHHFIHGLDLRPDHLKKLVGVRIEKTVPGYLIFWGATGVAE